MPIIPIDQLDNQSQSSGGIIPIDQMEKQDSMVSGGSQPTGKPFYDAIGATMTPEMKTEHPILAGLHQTAQDVATIGEKAANGLTLGALDYGLGKAGIQPPNFDRNEGKNDPWYMNNKSGLNLMGDAANIGSGIKAFNTIGSKVVAPVAKGIAKAVPEGLKQTSYALMQSIVNQLPKEFKYGANAGRAMVKEKLQGDAADIAEQAQSKIKEIDAEGDRLASSSNKPMDNSNAMKIIDDKISELKANAPRYSESSISRLENAKKDLLGVVEGKVKDPITGEVHNMASEGMDTSNMTPKETLDFKRKFDYQTQWKGTATDDSVVNSTLQQARRAVKDNLNEAVPGMKEWNQRYADLSAANQAAMRRVTYDQAGSGMRNILNNFVRGSIGMSTLGAALTGHGELAGEILAGWGAKEVLDNPMLKSKVAQMLYGASELDRNAIFKAVPWAKRFMDSMKDEPATPVEAELLGGKRLPAPKLAGIVDETSGPTIMGENPIKGLPNNYAPRRGPNPEVSMGGLPNPNTTAIPQGGYVPKGLPTPSQRVGINRRLPPPNKVGNSDASVINQGTDINTPVNDSSPKYGTDFAKQIQEQNIASRFVPLHPTKEGKAIAEEFHKQYYPDAVEGNPNISKSDLEDFNNMKDWEFSQNSGGVKISGGKQTGPEREVTSSPSGHSEAFKKVSGNSEKVGFDLIKRASAGEKMTPGEQLKIKMLIHDFRKNIKPKM